MSPPQKGKKNKSDFDEDNEDWDQQLAAAFGAGVEQIQQQQVAVRFEVFERLRGSKFWRWDLTITEHRQLYEAGGQCDCFNCIIGWPEKHGVRHPIYDYEKTVFDKLTAEPQGQNDKTYKHVWIKKATGLGITEFVLRFMVWLATKDDDLAGSTMCIVTGPNEALAQELVERIRMLFIEFPEVVFEVSSAKRLRINNVTIQAYPSNHLESARGIPNVSVFFLDEAAFFGAHAQDLDNPRTISERYVGKSGPYLIQCSTPNLPDDNFGAIEFEKDPMYKRVFLHYTEGLGKIYTDEEIARAKATPSFRREYELEYLGEFGDAFTPESIALAEKNGLECKAIIDNEIRQDTHKSMGVDAGWAKSAFAIVITQLNPENDRIEVLYAEEFIHPDFNDMIDLIIKLKQNYHVGKVFVDSANNPVIQTLKKILGEREDYQAELEKIRKKRPPDPARYMDVVPVSFNLEGRPMLIATKWMLDAGWLAIHPEKFDKLLVSLRTATAREGVLDKGKTAHDDILDALRLSLRYYSLPEIQQ